MSAPRTSSAALRGLSYAGLPGVSQVFVTAPGDLIGTVAGMSYSRDLTDEQWGPCGLGVQRARQRGPKPDVSHTGCQWRFLPESFEPRTRVWTPFRRWSRNGTGAQCQPQRECARTADERSGQLLHVKVRLMRNTVGKPGDVRQSPEAWCSDLFVSPSQGW